MGISQHGLPLSVQIWFAISFVAGALYTRAQRKFLLLYRERIDPTLPDPADQRSWGALPTHAFGLGWSYWKVTWTRQEDPVVEQARCGSIRAFAVLGVCIFGGMAAVFIVGF